MTPQSKWGLWRRLARLSWLSLGLAGGCCWSHQCCLSGWGYGPGGLKDPLKTNDLLVTKEGLLMSVQRGTRPDEESAAVTRFYRVEAEIWVSQAEGK